MCSFNAASPESITIHVCSVHKYDPHFHVYCQHCLRSYTKWNSYQKHIKRGCGLPSSTNNATPIMLSNSVEEPTPDDSCDPLSFRDDEQQDMPSSDQQVQASTQWHEAAFVLSIKEQYVMSQVAVDHVLSASKSLVCSLLENISENVSSLVPADITKVVKDQIMSVGDSLFHGVSTAHLQKEFFKNTFHLVVSEVS